MSTYGDRLAERLKYAWATNPGPLFGPLEATAVSAAQLHGALVWLVVLAGLGGFRLEFLPAVTAIRAAASIQLVTLTAFSALLAVWTAHQKY